MSETLRILIVEDNPADADFIREMLPDSGPVSFQIESVSRLADALTRLERKGIDLILLDLELPDGEGLATFRALRQAVPDIPVIVLTGNDDCEVAAAAVRAGAQDYLVKGQINASLLSRAARHALERQKAATGVFASEVRYRRLFESAKDGILVLDAETGMVLDVNPFLIERLGCTREEFIGKKVWELGYLKGIFANQDHFAELQQKEYSRFEDKPLETADGRKIDVEFASNVYLVSQQKVIQCNIRDITERKRVELSLREALAELRARNAELTRFNRAAVDRELRMIELKQEINELCRRLGEPPRHAMDSPQGGSVPHAGPDPAPPGEGAT